MDCGFTGTTFTLRDYGMSHDLVNQDVLSMENEGLPGVGFVEHCVVLYETNILGRGRYIKRKRASHMGKHCNFQFLFLLQFKPVSSLSPVSSLIQDTQTSRFFNVYIIYLDSFYTHILFYTIIKSQYQML